MVFPKFFRILCLNLILFFLLSLFTITLASSTNESDDFHINLHIYSYGAFNEETKSYLTEFDIDCVADENTPADTLSLFRLIYCIKNIGTIENITPKSILEFIGFDSLDSISPIDMVENPFPVYISDNVIVKFEVDNEEFHYFWTKPYNATANETRSYMLDASCTRIILSIPLNVIAVENDKMYTTSVDLVLWERDN